MVALEATDDPRCPALKIGELQGGCLLGGDRELEEDQPEPKPPFPCQPRSALHARISSRILRSSDMKINAPRQMCSPKDSTTQTLHPRAVAGDLKRESR